MKRSEELETVDCCQVIGLQTETVIVIFGKRFIGNPWRVKPIDSLPRSFYYSSGLILEPCLSGHHLARLGRTHTAKVLLTLPAFPREFVIVPHTDERPTRSRILQIGIEQIRAVNRPVVLDCCRDMEVADLFTPFEPNDVAETPAIHSLRAILRIPDNFVDVVSQMQHKVELICLCAMFVLEDHSTIGIAGALLYILTAHKSEL